MFYKNVSLHNSGYLSYLIDVQYVTYINLKIAKLQLPKVMCCQLKPYVNGHDNYFAYTIKFNHVYYSLDSNKPILIPNSHQLSHVIGPEHLSRSNEYCLIDSGIVQSTSAPSSANDFHGVDGTRVCYADILSLVNYIMTGFRLKQRVIQAYVPVMVRL